MMTAAGTIPASKVLVVGAERTYNSYSKRMGNSFCYWCKICFKEQVESLGVFSRWRGWKFRNRGGYAKEAGEDFKKQEELLAET